MAHAIAVLRCSRKTIAISALAALPLTGAAASSAAASCPLHKRYRVVASTSQAIVTVKTTGYNRGRDDTNQFKRYRGCWRATGREGEIASGERITSPGELEVNDFNGFTLNGPYVAFALQYASKYSDDVSTVGVRNLATKGPPRVAVLDGAGSDPATQIQLRRDGAVAFVAPVADLSNLVTVRLFGLSRNGLREFDRAPEAGLTDVRFDGALLRWRNRGISREETFDLTT